MSSWNFADLWEVCAEVRGDARPRSTATRP
jgi:hypothetical protein